MGALVVFTTELEFLLSVLSPTVESTLDSSILFRDTTPTKKVRTASSEPPPSLSVRKSQQFQLDMLHTPSTQSVVVCRCNPRSPRRNGSTVEPRTASQRS